MASESIDAVLDGGGRDEEEPGECSAGHGACVEAEEGRQVDGGFKVIGGREGLGGEGVMTGMADETLDGAEGFGMVRAEAGEPGGGIGSGDVESATRVRAESEVVHWFLQRKTFRVSLC